MARHYLPARFVDVFLKPRFDLVVGEESHIARMRYSQNVPIA